MSKISIPIPEIANSIKAQLVGKRLFAFNVNVFHFSLLLCVCIVMSACKKSNNCYVEECNGHYEIKSESMGIQGLQIIDLSQVWGKTNSFGFQNLNGNYRGEGDLYLDIKNNGDELIRAEEVISYVPSIWGANNDPVIQYIELNTFKCTLVLICENMIHINLFCSIFMSSILSFIM